MMFGLLIYSCATGTFLSRKIENLTYENLAVRFLTGNIHLYAAPFRLVGLALALIAGSTAAFAADAAVPQTPLRKAAKPRPNPAEPLMYEGCKSYDYPGRHAAILKLKQEINPQVVFIGDSITHHWGGQPSSRLRDGEKVLKSDLADYRTLNLGFGHDRTQHALWRLQNGEIDGINPDWVVINIGTNNLNDGNTAEEVMSGIRAICAEVQKRTPKARVVLMSVFPRERQPTHGRRKIVADLSRLIGAYSEKQKFINIDLAPQFVPADGVIPPALMPDALHLSAEGYKIWAKALLEVFKSKPGR